MKIKTLTAALACALPMTGAFAAALDRSGQSVSAFLQPNNYFEANATILSPNVKGVETAAASGGQNRKIGDMGSDYAFFSGAVKIQLNDLLSFGLLYDQPFGASAAYHGNNFFVTPNGDNTRVSVTTNNLSMIGGITPVKGITLYGGPVYQVIEGDVNLRGTAYSVFNGYNAKFENTDAWGWLVGAAYQIPEIALKASITYRSEIDHDIDATETNYGGYATVLEALGHPAAPVVKAAVANIAKRTDKTTITTPQSVNLDLQSGIMAGTVVFANIRWVNWKDFAIRPDKFGQVTSIIRPTTNGFNLVGYSDDQWSINAGIGRKLSEQWAGNVSVGYDSGAGNPVSTLGPTEGFYSVGAGLQFSPAPNYFVAGGVRYLMLGDAKAQSGSQAGTKDSIASFKDNDAVAIGLKVGYRF